MNDEEIKLIALEAAIEAELHYFYNEDGNRDTSATVLVHAASVIENYLTGKPQEWDDDEDETETEERKDN